MHNCRPHVKTKSINVIHRLGHLEPDLLSSVSDKVFLRLKDPDPRVVGSALGLLRNLVRVRSQSTSDTWHIHVDIRHQARVFGRHEALKLVLQEFLSVETRGTRTQRPQIQFIQAMGELVSGPGYTSCQPYSALAYLTI